VSPEQFRGILSEHVGNALEEVEDIVRSAAYYDFKRTLHTVPSELDRMIENCAARATNAAVEMLLNPHTPFTVHLESAKFLVSDKQEVQP
jgi:hypothetical protein